jgi:nitric oxide dioxygenase
MIEQHALIENAQYYLCGAIPFMAEQMKSLIGLGVCESNIHYEVFGSDVLLGSGA